MFLIEFYPYKLKACLTIPHDFTDDAAMMQGKQDRGRADGAREQAETLALSALGWILADDVRADRFLALTGLTPDDMRHALQQPQGRADMLRAILEFLCAHEPDLVAAAETLGTDPSRFAAALTELER